jgi:hypothetical protein
MVLVCTEDGVIEWSETTWGAFSWFRYVRAAVRQ